MHALSLSTRKVVVLTALLASLLGVLLAAPAAFAQCAPGDAEYGGGIDGCEDDSGASPGGGGSPGGGDSPGGSGPGSGSGGSGSGGSGSGGSSPGGGGGSSEGARLGPDASVTGVDSGDGAGSNSGGSSDSAISAGDDSIDGSAGAADKKASKKLGGRSLGEVLSGGTERVASPAASTNAGTRAAKNVSNDGGGAGLLWLLLALGAITAVAAGGVAVRRRQAQQGFGA